MTAKDLLRQNIEFAHRATRGYVEEFTDGELLVRSTPTANHAAWQLGHLVGQQPADARDAGPKGAGVAGGLRGRPQ